jgi:hypothetical protein
MEQIRRLGDLSIFITCWRKFWIHQKPETYFREQKIHQGSICYTEEIKTNREVRKVRKVDISAVMGGGGTMAKIAWNSSNAFRLSLITWNGFNSKVTWKQESGEYLCFSTCLPLCDNNLLFFLCAFRTKFRKIIRRASVKHIDFAYWYLLSLIFLCIIYIHWLKLWDWVFLDMKDLQQLKKRYKKICRLTRTHSFGPMLQCNSACGGNADDGFWTFRSQLNKILVFFMSSSKYCKYNRIYVEVKQIYTYTVV